MTIIIIKIVLVVLLLRVIALTVGHLIVVFCKDATKMAVNEIINFVRSEHMCKFMYNMIWILLFIKLLYGAFTGHITINT